MIVRFASVSDVREFVGLATLQPYAIDVVDGEHVVSAKNFMELFTINLPILCRCRSQTAGTRPILPKLPRASSSAESNAGAPIRPDGGVFCYIGGRGVKQVEREKPCEAVCWAL